MCQAFYYITSCVLLVTLSSYSLLFADVNDILRVVVKLLQWDSGAGGMLFGICK